MKIVEGDQGAINSKSIWPSPPQPPPRKSQQGVTDVGLMLLGHACPNLKSLKLFGCRRTGNFGLRCIAGKCRFLEELHLHQTPLVGDEGLIAIANNCPNLSILVLDACPSITSKAMEANSSCSMKLLKFLRIRMCPGIEADGIETLVSNQENLERIELASMKVSKTLLDAIAMLPKLQALSLKSCRGLEDNSFMASGTHDSFSNLKKVDIANCEKFTEKGLMELTRRSKRLMKLRLENCGAMTVAGLYRALANCNKTLEELSLIHCHLLHHEHIEVAEDHSLTAMNLADISFDDDGVLLSLLQVFGLRLNFLSISRCSWLNEEEITSLQLIGEKCPDLEHLDLSGSSISDEDLGRMVAGLQEIPLDTLSLSCCRRISDEGIVHLHMLCCTLRDLNLTNCPAITSGAVDALREVFYLCDILN